MTRGSSGFGPLPLRYPDIEAWARLTCRAPTPYEVECLLALDRTFMESTAKQTQDGHRR